MRPIPAVGSTDARLEHIAEVPFSVVAGPVGTYVAEWLAAMIASWDRWQGCVWLRAEALRSEALALELADACRHRWGADTGEPAAAPVTDAPRRLRHVLLDPPPDAVVVVEGNLQAVRGLRRLVADLRPRLVERRATVVGVGESPVARWGRLATRGHGLSDTERAGLSPQVRDRLWKIAGRRPAVLHDVLAAAQVWGADTVASAVASASSLCSLLERVTAELLDRCAAGELAALRTGVTSGYWHPQLTTPPVSAARLRPWFVALEESWCCLRPIWRAPLRRRLVGRHRRPGTPVARSGRVGPSSPSMPSHRGLVQARLLGELEIRVDGRLVRWRGRRGASVLRFLLARPQRACSRDELLATFWPEVSPQVARNRLQVAVSGLRRAFGAVTRVNVVEYVAEGYRINPALRVELDVDRFESVLAAGKDAERAGDAAAALARYREAVGHYRGDFAADAPSEHWTLVPRESLRLALVDALARIGRLELARGAFDDSIAAARRMLDIDPCREDAHRLLMRCFAGQGHPYQAHRQFELCCRVLRSSLDVEPAPDTVRLHHAIRAGSAAKPALIERWARVR